MITKTDENPHYLNLQALLQFPSSLVFEIGCKGKSMVRQPQSCGQMLAKLSASHPLSPFEETIWKRRQPLVSWGNRENMQEHRPKLMNCCVS